MEKRNLENLKNKKVALVLSGGVVKAAAWHLGVTLALEELGFHLRSNKDISDQQDQEKHPLEISTYVGSSAGAFIGALLASGLGSRDIIKSIIGINKDKMKPITYKEMFYFKPQPLRPKKSDIYHPLDHLPLPIKGVLKPFLSFSGFFSTYGLKKYLLENILVTDSFDDFLADLFVVTTQLDDSKKVIFGKYNYPNPSHDSTAVYRTDCGISDAVSASMAVPPFYSPFPINNPQTNQTDYYIDGEIRDTLSTHVAEDNGCEYIISSWTHTPYHYQDEIGSLVNYGLPSIGIQAIYLMIQKKIVTARAKRATALDILDTVNEFMRAEKFSESQRKSLLTVLERKLNVKRNVKLIDIYPDHEDYKLFFANSFSLNPKTASHAVRMGYKKTMAVMSEL